MPTWAVRLSQQLLANVTMMSSHENICVRYCHTTNCNVSARCVACNEIRDELAMLTQITLENTIHLTFIGL